MAELEYGVVRGRYRLVQSNVSRSAVGTVLFTPVEPDEIVDVPEETLYSRQSVEAVFDGDGWIHAAGTPVDYLRLPVGRWEVSFRQAKGLTIGTFQFDVSADETVNLPAVAPIKPSPAVKFVVNELVYTETLDARDETFVARDVAVQAAADAVAPTNTVVDARIALKRGAANGVAGLGSDSKLPETQVPDRLSASALSSTIGDVGRGQFAARIDPLGGGQDDFPRLQAAIDYWAARGGKSLLLGGSVFRLGSMLTVPTNFVLQGAGRRATMLKAMDGVNLPALVRTVGYENLVGTNSDGGVMHSGLMDLTLDGNKANNPTGGDGYQHYGALPIVERVHVRNFRGAGIRSEWSATATVEDGCEGSFVAVSVSDNTDGVVWAGPHDTTWLHCIAFRNTGKGFWIKPGSAIHVAIGCHSWGVQQQYAWYLEAETHLTSCQGEGASVAQVMIGHNDTVIRGGKYFGFPPASMKGFLVGDAQHPSPAGVFIDTKTANLKGGAVDFTYAGTGGILNLTSFQQDATPVLIAPNLIRASWQLNVRAAGNGVLDQADRFSITGGQVIRGADGAFIIVGTADVYNVNASSRQHIYPNGASLRGYSDTYATERWSVDGATGIATFSGVRDTTTALSTGEATLPRQLASSPALQLASGQMVLSYFTAQKTETISKVRLVCGNQAAAAGATLIRAAIYEVATNGDLTLVGATASDTTLLAAANTAYTANLAQPFTKTAGKRYAVGVLVVSGGTMPRLAGVFGAGGIASELAQSPRQSGAIGSLSDVPSSVTSASVGQWGGQHYTVLTP